MKRPAFRWLPHTCAAAVLLAVAPRGGAQAPPPAPAPKTAPVTAPPAAAPGASSAPSAPGASAGTGASAPPVAPPAELSNDQASYLFGLTFGEQLHSIGLTNEVNTDSLARGAKEGLQGKKSTQADRQQVQEYAHTMMTALQARNKSASQDFLARNGHEKGVKTTASGLQYKVLAPGDLKAAEVAATDEVTVNYRGKLLDGTEFDSSYARGVPATFPVGGVIKGWQEALVLMKPGAKWEIYVPPDLGYGAVPRPGIPANSLLIFDVDLLSAKSTGGSAQAPSAPDRGRTTTTPRATAPPASSPAPPGSRSGAPSTPQ